MTVRSGSKGDLHLTARCDAEGVEFVSIMFEMKNEIDDTAIKKKNEDFLKGARQRPPEEKVRVRGAGVPSRAGKRALQPGHRGHVVPVPKMYAIRPQFFIPMISILRNAALKLDGVQGGAGGGAQPEHRHHEFRGADGDVQGAASRATSGSGQRASSRRPSTRSTRPSCTCRRPRTPSCRPRTTCAWRTTRPKILPSSA